jgi:hypothetical protein
MTRVVVELYAESIEGVVVTREGSCVAPGRSRLRFLFHRALR